MNFSKFQVSAFVLFAVLLSSVSAWSAFEIHPRLMVGEEYNDNIDLDDKNKKDDWITTVAPGISLTYDARSLNAAIDYSLYFRFYKNHSSNDQDSFKEAQRVNATLLFFPGRPFTLLITETVTNVAIDERDNNVDYNESENRTTLYKTSVAPQYRWQLTPTFSLVYGYRYNRDDYVDSRGDDTEEHVGHVSLIKQVSAATDIFARYTYTDHSTDYVSDDGESDYDRQDYTLGINQQVSPRIKVSVEGGYSQINYKSGSNNSNPTGSINASYRFSAPVTFTLGYSYDYVNTPEDGVTERQEASFGVNYDRESFTASSELFWYKSNYVREDREDKGYGVRFDLSKPLSRALTADFNAEFGIDKYTDPDEKVDGFGVGGSLNYSYHRFQTSLGYRFRYSNSDLGNDYINNVVTLTGTVSF